MIVRLLIFSLFFLSLSSCAFKRVTRSKDIVYEQPRAGNHNIATQLSIFAPKGAKGKNVLVYLHGGNWTMGKKSLYNFLGSRFARKGVVMVTLDYPLSPGVTSNDMAVSTSHALKWVSENIGQYGGDPSRIFISGHSAGGQLAALVSLRNEYFDSLNIKNPIKGTVLIDAAGLDMAGYLMAAKLKYDHTYFRTFTHHPQFWKEQSPLYHLHRGMPPMLIYRGGKTYKMIAESNDKFLAGARSLAPDTEYHFQKGKHHIPMITQFFRTWNPRYKEIIQFMDREATGN